MDSWLPTGCPTPTPNSNSQNMQINFVHANIFYERTPLTISLVNDYHIRAMIYMKQFPRYNQTGLKLKCYVSLFDFNMWFGIWIICIFHLYKKELVNCFYKLFKSNSDFYFQEFSNSQSLQLLTLNSWLNLLRWIFWGL